MNKRKLAKEFYEIIRISKSCPLKAHQKILDDGYRGKELEFMFRLLYRWNEWQKLAICGGRVYYDYIEILKENI